MSRNQSRYLSWTRCRGRDGWNSPQDVRDDMAAELENVDLFDGNLGSKRPGTVTPTDLVGQLGSYTQPFTAMASWVPAQDETARELFLVDSTATRKLARYRSSDTIATLTDGRAHV